MISKLTLEEKIDLDLPLLASEITRATGYGRREIKKINPPFVCKKIRLSDFWRHVHTLQNIGPVVTIGADEFGFDFRHLGDYCVKKIEQIKAMHASPEPSNDPPSTVDKQRAPRSSNGPQGASPNLAESPPRNILSQMSRECNENTDGTF